MDCTIYEVKTKAVTSRGVTIYSKSRFSHDEAHLGSIELDHVVNKLGLKKIIKNPTLKEKQPFPDSSTEFGHKN